MVAHVLFTLHGLLFCTHAVLCLQGRGTSAIMSRVDGNPMHTVHEEWSAYPNHSRNPPPNLATDRDALATSVARSLGTNTKFFYATEAGATELPRSAFDMMVNCRNVAIMITDGAYQFDDENIMPIRMILIGWQVPLTALTLATVGEETEMNYMVASSIHSDPALPRCSTWKKRSRVVARIDDEEGTYNSRLIDLLTDASRHPMWVKERLSLVYPGDEQL
jgi:hypothetical protein